jgi:hypothetical protein
MSQELENVVVEEEVVMEEQVEENVPVVLGEPERYLYNANEFGASPAKEALEKLKGKFEFPADGNIQVINDRLEEVRFAMRTYGRAPKYVISRSLYPTVENADVLSKATFTVRPAVKSKLEVADLDHKITLFPGEDFFDRFIDEMADWFDNYRYHFQLQTNLDALNGEVSQIIVDNEIPFSLTFSLGTGLIDATDAHAVVGMSDDVIIKLSTLSLFDTDLPTRAEGYRNSIIETLKVCTRPYEIVKVKTPVTKALGIYSRRAVSKLMREFVSRKINFVRVGTGYVETEEYFAVIDKNALTEEEVAQLDPDQISVEENKNASVKEKEAGKTKIVSVYRISPFSKQDGTPQEFSFTELLKIADDEEKPSKAEASKKAESAS